MAPRSPRADRVARCAPHRDESPRIPARGHRYLRIALLAGVLGFTRGAVPTQAQPDTILHTEPAAAAQADGLVPAIRGERGGTVRVSASDGRHVYLALHARLMVLDAELAPEPALVGTSAPLGWRISALDARAGLVLAVGPELAVLDARDPARIAVLAQLPLLVPARAVAWVDDVAWLIGVDDRLWRVDLADPSRPRSLGSWIPPAAGTSGGLFSPGNLLAYDDRLLLNATLRSGPELLIVVDGSAVVPTVRTRFQLPCCVPLLYGEGDDLVVLTTATAEEAYWLRLGANEELSDPVPLPAGDAGIGDRLLAAAVHDDAFWTMSQGRRVRRVPLAAQPMTRPYLDLRGTFGPAVLQSAGQHLLFTVPGQAGWLAEPEDPDDAMAPGARPRIVGDLPPLGDRGLREMAALADGALLAVDEAPLLFAPRAPDAAFEPFTGTGRFDELVDLHADGELLFARSSGRLIHWRREGPRALSQFGELPLLDFGGAGQIHAADDGLLAYSSSERLVVLEPDGEGDARRVAIAVRTRWHGRSRIRDGLLWLIERPSGPPPRLAGLHLGGGSVYTLDGGTVGPGGGVAAEIAWSGDLALLGAGSDLVVLDLSDPERPVPRGRLDLPGPVVSVALDATTGWAAWHEPRGTRIGLFDLRVPGFPEPLGPDLPLAAEAVSVAIHLHESEAWLLVDDALQQRHAAPAPTSLPSPTATTTTTTPTSTTPTRTAPPEPTATSRPAEVRPRLWLPWAYDIPNDLRVPQRAFHPSPRCEEAPCRYRPPALP